MNAGGSKGRKAESGKAGKRETGEKAGHLRREPTERMLRIHEYLAAGEYPNCGRLAREFEVSPKTVERDVEFMRDHFDLPIKYDSHRRGFFYTRPVVRFPGGTEVGDTEIFALVVAHKASAQYQGLPLEKPLESGFKKLLRLVGGVSEGKAVRLCNAVSFRPVGVEVVDPHTMTTVTNAVTEQHALVFSYRKPGEEPSQRRRVLPYHVVCADNRFYLLGHDEDLGQIRRFKIGRMVDLVDTGKAFERPGDFSADRYLASGFVSMTGSGDYEVLVEFDRWATDIMRGRRWHASQVVAELPDGRSVFGVRVSCLDEIERWVLSWGGHAMVIEPRELQHRVLETLGKIVARYRPNF